MTDEATSARLQTSKLTVFSHGTRCDHLWDGDAVETKNSAGEKIRTLTCSKCGAWAVDVYGETA